MYNQGGHQQNVFMNGGHNARFGLQQNKTYQNHGHPNSAQQSRQVHEHQAHDSFSNHQHNSSTGFSSGGTPQFSSNQMRNSTPNNTVNGTLRLSENWLQQQSLYQNSRDITISHAHARNNLAGYKGASPNSAEAAKKELSREERQRPVRVEVTDSRQAWHELDMSGQSLRAVSSNLFRYKFLTKLFLDHNKLQYLPPSIGKLSHLNELHLSYNQLTELPGELGMLVKLKQLLVFDNIIQELPPELGYLFALEMLGIDGNPLSPECRQILMEHGTQELVKKLREEWDGPEAPDEREWLELDSSRQTTDVSQYHKFKVVSFNILAPTAAPQNAYPATPSPVLNWDYRKELVLKELKDTNADVICLQEIDSESYNEFFRPKLAHFDYKGYFHPRLRAKTMSEREQKTVDGCATFYKNSKFILLDKQFIEISTLAINKPDMRDNDVYNRIMPRDHIATVMLLENRTTGSRLIVGNAHLYWDPLQKDVKLVQAAIVMEQISKVAEQFTKQAPCKDKSLYRFADADSPDGETRITAPLPDPLPSQEYTTSTNIPLVICGDFNSSPDSGVYELIGNGSIPGDHPDFQGFKYGNYTKNGASHPFGLKSAYSNIDELTFTNHTAFFTGVLDYIWYSPSTLQPTSLLGEIDPEYMERVPGFPNRHFPSDHITLAAEFIDKAGAKRQPDLSPPTATDMESKGDTSPLQPDGES